MRKAEIEMLFDYTYWANHRVLAAAKLLTVEQLDQIVLAGSPCILDILAHSLGAEIMWWTRFSQGITLPAIPGRAEYPTLEDLVSRWQAQEGNMRGLLAGLSEEELGASMRYTTTKGKLYEMPRWELLVHLVNHETQHRAEIAMLLTALGKSPGDLDIILYLRER